MPQTPENVIKALQNKEYKNLYLLGGEETFFTDSVCAIIEEQLLLPHERDFNQFVFYGRDTTLSEITATARRFPMMAERQLVIVKEAQDLPELNTSESSKLLEALAAKAVPTTVLVLCFKTQLDERKAFVKAFDKFGILLNTKPLYENKLPDWITGYVHQRGVKISKSAVMMLAEHTGTNLQRLANELDKIILNLKADEGISAETVERFVGISRTYNSFEFQKALIQKDLPKAIEMIHYFVANPKANPLQVVVTVLFNYFSKLLLAIGTPNKSERNLAAVLGVNPYFVNDYLIGLRNFSFQKTTEIIHVLRETDAASKGLEGRTIEEEDLLKDLVLKITT